MVDEIYDVLDEQEKVIGRATWTEVHTKGLWHQTAAVFIFRDDTKQEILLQKRSMLMKQKPGLWQHSAGGHILAGDTADEGIRREIQEELFAGHQMPPLQLTHITKFRQQDFANNNEIVHIYEALYPGPFFPDKKELAGQPKWFQ